MNKYILTLLTTLIATSVTYPEAMKEGLVSSTNASYDGNALLLTGHVVLDHGLGKMNAEEASLEKQEAGKDFPFSLIHLKKEVFLSLKNHAHLSCDVAQLDFNQLKGYLTAPQKGFVCYTDTILNKGKDGVKVSLESQRIELSMLKIEKGDQKAEYDIETLKAKESVKVNYDSNFLLEAEEALYRRLGGSLAAKEFQGIISAYPKDDQSHCKVIHFQDEVLARSIDLDLQRSTLSMHQSQGTIHTSFLPDLQKGLLQFNTEHFIWNEPDSLLTLKGKSFIQESSLGTISSEELLTIQQGMLGDKKVISKVESRGPAEFIYMDPSSKSSHKLKCFGQMKIDREHLSARLTSPKKEAKQSRFTGQIYYEESIMGAYADAAAVEFAAEGTLLQPITMHLKGNVCLFSRNPQEPFRCGIADRMHFSPETKTLILCANPGQKVLFWDEQQAVRMSAQEVHLTVNPLNQQTVIQGVGNVKFSLSTEENEALKNVFPQFKPL
ncbi:MAG: hypothetical protein EBZ47_02950 [Chlamydiae bacterium]|nr:hypothetical protein [Chlamydiota bacterium]